MIVKRRRLRVSQSTKQSDLRTTPWILTSIYHLPHCRILSTHSRHATPQLWTKPSVTETCCMKTLYSKTSNKNKSINFTTSSLQFSLVSTALWDLANSRPVHSLMLPSHIFFSACLVFFPLSLCLVKNKRAQNKPKKQKQKKGKKNRQKGKWRLER